MNKVKNKVKNWFIGLSLVKKFFFGFIVVLLVFFGYKIFFSKKQTAAVVISQVTRGTIVSTISESGNVAAATQVSVGSPTDGVIKTLYVTNGDKVVAGQKLFEVKSTATEEEKAAAYASYLSAVNSEKTAEAGKISSQATLERDRQSVIDASSAVTNMQNNLNTGQPNPATKQAYTQNETDSINSTLTSARTSFSADELKYNTTDNNIGSAKSNLTASWLAYQATQDSVVTAPIDGIAANMSVAVGSTVAASTTNANSSSSTTSSSSSSSSNGTSVLLIGNFDNMIINTTVNEIDITKIKAGENATITLDAFPTQTFVGQVYSVDSIGAISSGVVSFNVYVKMIDPPGTVHSGMTASVIIQTERKDNVLSVPSTAVQTTNGQAYVRVKGKNGQITQVAVTTGISSDTDTEIISGLNEGDNVVMTNIVSTTSTGTSSTASPFSAIGGFGGGGGAVRRGN
jgi:macrolide-specific efflux system membrane fusion protein